MCMCTFETALKSVPRDVTTWRSVFLFFKYRFFSRWPPRRVHARIKSVVSHYALRRNDSDESGAIMFLEQEAPPTLQEAPE